MSPMTRICTHRRTSPAYAPAHRLLCTPPGNGRNSLESITVNRSHTLQNKLKINIVFVIAVVAFASCRSQQPESSSPFSTADKLNPITPRSERHSFCGVESYNESRDPACGVEVYNTARTAACGVESYHARADMSCVGSIAAETYQERSVSPRACADAPGVPSCRSGFAQVDYSEPIKYAPPRPPAGDGCNFVGARIRTCAHGDLPATCRKPEFGVEQYNACAHESHGVERYKSCRLPAFGVEAYASCSFHKTPTEINSYVETNAPLVDLFAESIVTGIGNFYAFSEDQPGLACIIKNYSNDPFFDAVVLNIKTMYTTKFGLEYDPAACTSPAKKIEEYTCSDEDASSICRNWRIWKTAMRWVEVRRIDIRNMLDDVARFQWADQKSSLESMKNDLDKKAN